MVLKKIETPLGEDGDASLPLRPKEEPKEEPKDEPQDIQMEEADDTNVRDARVEILPLQGRSSVIVKVTPPSKPEGMVRSPVDIVLVIDVSYSMSEDAPVPTNPGETAERTGFSVLDLVKHASRTILESLNKHDRLGIVAFSSNIELTQPLTPMDKANKRLTSTAIGTMKPSLATNLWAGISEGLKLFKDRRDPDCNRVPALLVLTDGVPNHLCPQRGYVRELRAMGQLPATIHTFGFGYKLRSGLLKSIAEIGGGGYSFIPDAGMIGTIFVNAVANLQSTFATQATLRITYPDSIEMETTTGASVADLPPVPLYDTSERCLTIQLGDIQYGQDRDIYLRYGRRDPGIGDLEIEKKPMVSHDGRALPISPETSAASVSVVLKYTRMTPEIHQAVAHKRLNDFGKSPTAVTIVEAVFHESRSMLCEFIAGLFPVLENGYTRVDGSDDGSRVREHRALEHALELVTRLQNLLDAVPAKRFLADKYPAPPDLVAAAADPDDVWPINAALMDDIRGQVSMAVTNPQFWYRWGVHYLPSLHSAHARQQCNSFKDQGPLLYGRRSELFVACRRTLNDAFNRLPPPEPSNIITAEDDGGGRGGWRARPRRVQPPVRMDAYNSRINPCFAGTCKVLVTHASAPWTDIPDPREPGERREKVDGSVSYRYMSVSKLRRGMRVMSPSGPRTVAAVLKTRVVRASLVRVGPLIVTPWHPISRATTSVRSPPPPSSSWVFPRDVSQGRITYTGAIYSIMLEESSNSSSRSNSSDGRSRRGNNANDHAILVGGSWAVTLGHGVTSGSDVRAHAFLGDYAAVARSLAAIGASGSGDGVVRSGGVKRDPRTGQVCGFLPYSRRDRSGAQANADEAVDAVVRNTTE